jgi:hypothetical protein
MPDLLPCPVCKDPASYDMGNVCCSNMACFMSRHYFYKDEWRSLPRYTDADMRKAFLTCVGHVFSSGDEAKAEVFRRWFDAQERGKHA